MQNRNRFQTQAVRHVLDSPRGQRYCCSPLLPSQWPIRELLGGSPRRLNTSMSRTRQLSAHCSLCTVPCPENVCLEIHINLTELDKWVNFERFDGDFDLRLLVSYPMREDVKRKTLPFSLQGGGCLTCIQP